MAYGYDPELAPIVPVLPSLDISDVAAARAAMLELRAQGPEFVAPESLFLDRRTVPGPSGQPDIELRIIAPKGRAGPVPGLYWIHGGGFVFGSADDEIPALARVAEALGVMAVSVEYRLAPEHPFPNPVEDCYAGLRWVAEHAGELGIDPARLAIGGQSAGGGLAAALALLARDRGGPPVCFHLLDIPELDDRVTTESVTTYVDTPLWNHANAVLSWRAYLGDGHAGPVSPYAAPARAGDLAGLPPAYVVTCEFDPLRDEGLDYAHRLIRAGVPTELHHYPGTFHGSAGVGAGTAISERMVADRIDALARTFSRTGEPS
jgi:acetyl esterase/lipase